MIVAVDGASTDLSLALATPDGEPREAEAWTSVQRQSSELLPRLLGLLQRTGTRLDEVTALAVGTGPGSFTGLRVAMALAKGLAFALQRPIVGVPSLDAWLHVDTDAVAAVARAGAREAYVLARGEEAAVIGDRERVVERLGDARIVAPSELAEAFGLRQARPPAGAAGVAALAARRLADGGGDDLRRLEPIYLRAPRGVPEQQAEGTVRWL